MIKPNSLITNLCLISTTLLMSGCNQEQSATPSNPVKEVAKQESSMAILKPTNGNTASGSISFTQQPDGILIKAQITGLTPGSHGFHIHEKGDCSSGDGKSAGGHLNPNAVNHSDPDQTIRHVGDLGNITADENGRATYQRLDKVIRFAGKNNIIGKGFIVHAGTDDMKTQPTGAAGARVACGVITKPNG